MSDHQQTQNLIFQLGRKIEDLESRLRRIEATVSNVDSNVVRIGQMVQKQQKAR